MPRKQWERERPGRNRDRYKREIKEKESQERERTQRERDQQGLYPTQIRFKALAYKISRRLLNAYFLKHIRHKR